VIGGSRSWCRRGAHGVADLLAGEPTDPTQLVTIFGGTTEIQKEIIARSLGL
jgi:alkylation response protein AidB-like acyl-CoA dehydrogenase